MKKFFSILCALAIVLGVNAASVSKKDFADKKVVNNEVRQQQSRKRTSAQAVPFKSATKKVAPKAFEKKTAVKSFQVANAVKASVAKAPQAKQEATDVTVASWSIQDYGTDGELYLYGVDYAYVFYFDLIYGDDAEDLVPGKEYTVADVYVSASTGEQYAGIYYDSQWHYGVKTLSLTKTIDAEGLVHFAGSVVDSLDGEWTFHFDGEPAPVYPEGGEFECDNASFSYYSTDGDAWYKLTVAEPEMIFRFDVIVGEGLEDVKLDSTYTLDDMIANYTYVSLGDDKLTFKEVSFLKSANEDGSADLNVTAVDENDNTWKLHYAFPAAPEAEKFETITADVTMTKEPYVFWTLYTFEAADEANAIVLELLPDDAIYGTWEAGENADITGAVTPLNGLESEIFSGEVTIEQNVEGFKITGKVLCWNSTEYTLDLTYTIPDATRQAELTLENLELGVFEGAWQLAGFNEDGTQYISIAAYTDEITGTYTEADLAADYCYIYTDLVLDEEGNVEEGNYFELLKANLTVAFNEADSTITIAGTFRAQNADDATDIPEFTLALSGRIPAEEVSDMTFTFAEDAEGITVTPSNNEDAWDWYVVDEATFEYYGADYIAEAIYGNYGDQYAVTGEQFLSFDEDIAYYTKDGGVYYLIVWGAGKNNITTEPATFEFEVEAGAGDPNDAKDEAFKFVFEEYTIDDQYFEQYGVLVVEAQDAENHYISLEIETETAELAAGVYTVGQEVAAGEIDQYIYGSFAGNKTAQGVSVPLWLIVEGTVTVYENGPIAVKATNTWGAEIECLLGTWPEAIDNTDAKATITKSIKNGQFIIIKNGVEYNAQGAIVK